MVETYTEKYSSAVKFRRYSFAFLVAEKVSQAATLYICIQEVPGLNLFWVIHYRYILLWSFLQFILPSAGWNKRRATGRYSSFCSLPLFRPVCLFCLEREFCLNNEYISVFTAQITNLFSITKAILRIIKRQNYPCNSPRRPIWLWDVEASTFSRQSIHRWRWGC
jgi:hypothetical protein